MKEISNIAKSAVANIDINFEYFQIKENLYAYRRTQSSKVTHIVKQIPFGGPLGGPGNGKVFLTKNFKATDSNSKLFSQNSYCDSSEGFIDEKNLQNYLKEKVSFPQKLSFSVFDSSSFELLKTKSFSDFVATVVDSGYFEKFKSEEYTENNICMVDYSGNMLFDVDNQVIPQKIHFSYLSGNMSNDYYALDEVLKLLKTNPQVVNLCEEILPIPHYNCDEEGYAQLTFDFLPTKEQVNQMWEWQKKAKSYPSTKTYYAISKFDLLGIEKFKKVKI